MEQLSERKNEIINLMREIELLKGQKLEQKQNGKELYVDNYDLK